ncbi:MAG: hypothetical protein RJQ07_03805 [Pseudomonadales bacterium]
MTGIQPQGRVGLLSGHSALQLLHQLLVTTAESFATAFAQTPVPQLKAFRKSYPEYLARFEAARLASGQASSVAHHLSQHLQDAIGWWQQDRPLPLSESLGQAVAAPRFEHHEFDHAPGWLAQIDYAEHSWQGDRLSELTSMLHQREIINQPARTALDWAFAHILRQGGLDLRGRKIALLGAGAEMAPTRLWLAAGADVLWLDPDPPPAHLLQDSDLAGRLSWLPQGCDLLSAPHTALAALREFAAGEPLDLGLYAYAPGQARELLLVAVMNALVEALAQEQIASVTMLISPTTPTALGDAELAQVEHRWHSRPRWQRICLGLGLLSNKGGFAAVGSARASRSVVGIQGASYQAAQYIGKIMTAISWAESGALQSTTAPLRVSANTAAITRTRSLQHPVFNAAFGGATAFGVETMSSAQSQVLNGMLTVADLLRPEAPQPAKVRVHGGIHTLPYPLDSALYVAAAIGFVRHPALLMRLLKA